MNRFVQEGYNSRHSTSSPLLTKMVCIQRLPSLHLSICKYKNVPVMAKKNVLSLSIWALDAKWHHKPWKSTESFFFFFCEIITLLKYFPAVSSIRLTGKFQASLPRAWKNDQWLLTGEISLYYTDIFLRGYKWAHSEKAVHSEMCPCSIYGNPGARRELHFKQKSCSVSSCQCEWFSSLSLSFHICKRMIPSWKHWKQCVVPDRVHLILICA